jgi:protein-S-isoprenylcysteine O-methyltransferase Ste14
MTVETICRIALAAFLLTAMALAGRHRRAADRAGGRVSRSHDPAWFWACMFIVFPPLMGGYLLFIIHPAWLEWSRVPLPDAVRLGAIGLGVIAWLGFRWMFIHLGHNVTPTSMPRANATLVTSGPFRWVRHPMYSFGILLFISFALVTSNWFIALGVTIAFTLLALRSRLEERRLVEKFGDAYRHYQRHTGRFIPRLLPRGDHRSSSAMNGA